MTILPTSSNATVSSSSTEQKEDPQQQQEQEEQEQQLDHDEEEHMKDVMSENAKSNNHDKSSGDDHSNNSNGRDCFINDMPRLIPRNLPYDQSLNKMDISNNITNTISRHGTRTNGSGGGVKSSIQSLLVRDWFHVILRLNVLTSVGLLLGIWTGIILLFAWAYMLLDSMNLNTDCGLGPPGTPIELGPAFAFSLETCTTVGYGLPGSTNAYFEDNCPSVQGVIYLQMVWSMMFNAFLFAFYYTKLAKSESRGIQVVFSNRAIIKQAKLPKRLQQQQQGHADEDGDDDDDVDDNIELQIRVYDVDCRHPVVEAHFRMYVIMKDGSLYDPNNAHKNNHTNKNIHNDPFKTNAFQPKPLRVVCPNDELGSMLFLSLPTVVTHEIDEYSHISPSAYYNKNNTNTNKNRTSRFLLPRHTRLQLRSVDALTGSRDDYICPVCAECYGTYHRLKQHVQFNAYQELHGEIPNGPLSHQSIDIQKDLPPPPPSSRQQTPSIPKIQSFFRDCVAEIICVVEGIDPLTSGTFQALHSYRYEDIVWGYDPNDPHHHVDLRFQDCVHITNTNGNNNNNNPTSNNKRFQVDLNKFHSIVTTKTLTIPPPTPKKIN